MLFLGALLVTLFFPISTSADQIAITDLPLFTRADFDVKYCVSAEQLDWISTFGCAVTNPAACLCSDSSTSYRVASAISDCVDGEIGWSDGRSDLITATGIFASYCLTNAGISAHDETLLEDFSIYTEGPAQIANCARSVSSAYSTSLGCDFYTPAACLCGQSSFVIQSAMLSCASEDVIYSPQFVASTITELWSSYCSVNLAHPATRQDEPIITDIGSGPTGGAPSSAAPSATASTPMNTATGSQSGSSTSAANTPTSSSSSSSSGGSSSSGSSSTNSGLSVGAEVGLAIGCAFGAALLTMIATWWKPRQLGRFLTCGTWPRKEVDNHTARTQMTHIFTGPFRPAPHVYV